MDEGQSSMAASLKSRLIRSPASNKIGIKQGVTTEEKALDGRNLVIMDVGKVEKSSAGSTDDGRMGAPFFRLHQGVSIAAR
jgi:hypothetical protein